MNHWRFRNRQRSKQFCTVQFGQRIWMWANPTFLDVLLFRFMAQICQIRTMFSLQQKGQFKHELYAPNSLVIWSSPVADPGFSRGGGVNPPGGAWTRQIFPKTAWNRKNLDAQGGGVRPSRPPRSANVHIINEWTCSLSNSIPLVTLRKR